MSENGAMTLLELNALVREAIESELTGTYRVTAELSEVRTSAKGHCFIELIQKSERSNAAVAKARGVIMAGTFQLLKLDFEETTGQAFCAGLQVLMEVRPTFSELYGYSLVVTDIDPTYTMGDMARKRQEIIERLRNEGVLELNKTIPLPMLIQNIAVVSSPTAAGYGDFCHQLDGNAMNYRFRHKLFAATMQGELTEPTIIQALEAIANDNEAWDAVVIIRGGGAVSDLNGFETYNLANHCAQFPVPIITGIGHERDTTVLDEVACVSLKTPTAVADFLIARMDMNAQKIQALFSRMKDAATEQVEQEKRRLHTSVTFLQQFSKGFRQRHELLVNNLFGNIVRSVRHRTEKERLSTDYNERRLKESVRKCLADARQRLYIVEQAIDMNNPQRILKLGYSITLKDGKALKRAADVKPGDIIVTRLHEGNIESTVNGLDETISE